MKKRKLLNLNMKIFWVQVFKKLLIYQKILEGIKLEYINNEEDFFYEIVTNIKFLDEINIDIKVKNAICFIDLPGFGIDSYLIQKLYNFII